MTAQWPRVVARLVELLPTLPGWRDVGVYWGAAFDDVPGAFITVAHSTDGTTTTAGHYATSSAEDGYRTIETGSVACQLTCTDPGDSLAGVSAQAFTLLDELDMVIREDRTLEVLSSEGTSDLEVDVTSVQTGEGSAQTLAFTFNYFTIT